MENICTRNVSQSNHSGGKSLALLSTKLAKLKQSISDRQKCYEEEEFQFQQIKEKLCQEKEHITRQLAIVNQRCAEITDSITHTLKSSDIALLQEELQRLSNTELGLQVLKLRVEEEICSLRERIVQLFRRNNSTD
ncbi:uncharacterized protein TM35_000025100 [Trypanosoma theileri]|uniref:Uncharacterized protein n=1 Tax=Trypanosoma theileri TaxID=67003 RepID=A0A1X0P8C8_9TRYP|nr:uncharacterized protein TM35_000025100 [Trypanosoma theileri]ORC93184.1 hypothetical protein TM35_000025100 [Trypanosoma theileri]